MVQREQHQIEAVKPVQNTHIKGRGDGALLHIAADVQILVPAAVGQLMDEAGVAVERKDDGLVGGEQHS